MACAAPPSVNGDSGPAYAIESVKKLRCDTAFDPRYAR